MMRSVYHGDLLRKALLAQHGASRADSLAWADRILPPDLEDTPTQLLDSFPGFSDARFDEVPFPGFSDARFDEVPLSLIVEPLAQPWLPRLPNQRAAPAGSCPRGAFDLMPRATRWKVECGINRTVEDLRCIRDRGEDCERSRPPVLIVAQSELYRWAQTSATLRPSAARRSTMLLLCVPLSMLISSTGA
jgi:hypothetical protein